jgi:hypothetical protein
VVVERRSRYAGVVGDLPDARSRIAAGGEEADGGITDAGSGVGISLGNRSIDYQKLASDERRVNAASR